MMEAVLSNADHPEYGVATIPLPIPRNQYDHCVSLLEALEIGGASEADCRLDSLDRAWPVLNRLVCTKVNLDELDYLAKRLDSFTVGEFSQFQAMAEKLNLASMKDLINLTFCCQQATVITDFTNLKEIGRDHYMGHALLADVGCRAERSQVGTHQAKEVDEDTAYRKREGDPTVVRHTPGLSPVRRHSDQISCRQPNAEVRDHAAHHGHRRQSQLQKGKPPMAACVSQQDRQRVLFLLLHKYSSF